MQLWILEDVASNLLACSGEGAGGGAGEDGVASVKLVRSKAIEHPVSRVYYMENESVATLSEFYVSRAHTGFSCLHAAPRSHISCTSRCTAFGR